MNPTRAVVAMLAVACTISEDAFPDRVADATCDRVEECTEVFETEEERTDCEGFWGNLAELFIDLADLGGAEYSPSRGAQCVQEIRAASCAEFNDGQVPCELFDDAETE